MISTKNDQLCVPEALLSAKVNDEFFLKKSKAIFKHVTNFKTSPNHPLFHVDVINVLPLTCLL